ncbi:TonB-dependent receptor [Nitrospirillum iridis]|uniref:Iron complex outermembrane receptor protein n=1 Tax=Nitrospirillum iridis TaxID=765888 RepID=A0A7X0EI04_9PROT|nr:TonB-dependent receptor [Nitrospirillum iridis]MBB6255239.1 iron complex outermembrane receptor protein [Nitrospirillum iridis]
MDRMVQSKVRPLLLAGASFTSILWGAAFAQTASASPLAADQSAMPAEDQHAADTTVLQEVVVTAQKRAEKAQDVPIAITALSSEALTASGTIDTSDLKALTPGLNFNTALAGYGQPRIRGVGTTAQGPGIENPVATYVDGVYIASPSGALFSLIDVDQVAVLKGPQGTLFGRNATGGLIQVTSRTPTPDFTADLQTTYGNYNTVGTSGYVSGGLANGLMASAAVMYENQGDGFGKNLVTGQDVQTHRSIAGRGKLLWQADADTDITLSGDYAQYKAADPAFHTFSTNILGVSPSGGNYDIALDQQPYVKTENWGTSLTAKHDFDSVQLLSISAYRESSLHTIFDPDETAAPLLNLDISQHDKQFSQELQLLSTNSGPLKWVLGAYYFWADQRYDPSNTSGSFLPGTLSLFTNQLLNSYAAFGQGTYALGDDTNLTAGLRYTMDDRSVKSSEVLDIGGFLVTPVTPVNESKSFNKLTWRLSLDHRFSPELLAYASYNRGFKGGSFTAMAFPEVVLKPEVLDAYEVGLKSDLLNRRLRVNVAAFYYDYQNIQVNQIQNGLLFVYNAQGAHSYGMDADIEAQVTNHLSFNAGVSLLHARYTSFPAAFLTTPLQTGGNAVGTVDASGNHLQNTPDFTFNLGGRYIIPISFGDITVAANYYYNGGYYTAPENRLKQPHYNVLDASVTWTSTDDRYSLRFWAKNLTDQFYTTQMDATNFGDSWGSAPPRTFGVTAGLHF